MTRRYAAVAAVLVALGSTGQRAQEPTAKPEPTAKGPLVGRSVVATTFGIVAASQPLAARAGVQILERGGNAIDAAIAANATIGLMEPTGEMITSPHDMVVVELLRQEAFSRSGSSPSAHSVPTDVFVFGKGEPASREVTKVGGVPYWPAARPWPASRTGKPLTFVAQFASPTPAIWWETSRATYC